jgi:hypothetical protein
MDHPRPFYYLENFATALACLRRRYGDLLNGSELDFIDSLTRLPTPAAALCVRMIGRKGDLFRHCKLRYEEIGDVSAAAAPLVGLQWLEPDPLLSVTELATLLRRDELAKCLAGIGEPDVCGIGPLSRALSKAELLRRAAAAGLPTRRWSEWQSAALPDEPAWRLSVNELCDRLRLLFFGNFRQGWSEFVLADLGIFRYETLAVDAMSRAFQSREQIDIFHALYRCRQALEQGAALEQVMAALPPPLGSNDWLEYRRSRLEFELARQCERAGLTALALQVYQRSRHSGSRARHARLLERQQCYAAALQVSEPASEEGLREFELQQLQRIARRLQRRSAKGVALKRAAQRWCSYRLQLPVSRRPVRIEQAVADALARPDAPIHFVESRLLNSLFGLLFWDVIFAPLPGAFFHEFQAAPADLYADNFVSRRRTLIDRCLALLQAGGASRVIQERYAAKRDIQSPFVCWGMLSEGLLAQALACIPAAHLSLYFTRLLADLQANRNGLPDLIQFFPAAQTYRLIEVKGPGDRLQDNQLRWLQYCARHGLPAELCHVGWAPVAGCAGLAVLCEAGQPGAPAGAGEARHLGAL